MNTIVYRLILIAAWEAQEVEKSEQAGGDEAREGELQVSREEGGKACRACARRAARKGAPTCLCCAHGAAAARSLVAWMCGC